MTWKNDAQKCAAIGVLLRPCRMEAYWSPLGPTDAAIDLLERGGGPLSTGEALMLRVAFDVWNGCGNAPMGELMATLDAINLGLVSGLLAALACTARELDVWIQHNGELVPPIGALIMAERIANQHGSSIYLGGEAGAAAMTRVMRPLLQGNELLNAALELEAIAPREAGNITRGTRVVHLTPVVCSGCAFEYETLPGGCCPRCKTDSGVKDSGI